MSLQQIAREIAALKRHDPNGPRGYVTRSLTLNVPVGLLERLDAALAAPEAMTEQKIGEIWTRVSGRPFVGGSMAHAFATALLEAAQQPEFRVAGVWEPDGSKFRTYRRENLNGRAMYVKEPKE